MMNQDYNPRTIGTTSAGHIEFCSPLIERKSPMLYRMLFGILIGCLGLATFAGVAQADTVSAGTGSITFALVNADLTGTPGDTLTWQYDVTNNSGEAIQAAYVTPSGSFSGGTADASVFDAFSSLGGTLPDGASLIGTLFNFSADPSVPSSFNSGTFDLGVVLEDGTLIDLFENYSATITAPVNVPEPRSLTLLLSGLLIGVFTLRRAGR